MGLLGNISEHLTFMFDVLRAPESVRRQFEFFATREDILEIFRDDAIAQGVKFVDMGVPASGVPVTIRSISEITDLSVSLYGEKVRERSFLIVDAADVPRVRSVKQRKGGVRFFIDQLSHPNSVCFSAGGVYGETECVVPGVIGTISRRRWSIDLYAKLHQAMRERFAMVDVYFVGPRARRLLDSGVRFTSHIRAPVEFDLKGDSSRGA